MTKKLDREFGRFDVDFTDSVEYLNMRPGMRAHAYLYLLALTGWSRKHRTDGLVAKKVARELGQRMGRDYLKLLRSLEEVSMISMRNEDVFVTKYSKWQETREEIEAHKAANRVYQRRHRQGIVRPDSALSQATEREKEREKEKESLIAPPTPYARGLDAFEDETVVELARGMHEVFQRALSPLDVTECQLALNQYAYLTAADLIGRAQAHQDWCVDNGHPIKRTVGGFSDTWRRQNEHQADSGMAKPDRVIAGRSASMTKAFEVAS